MEIPLNIIHNYIGFPIFAWIAFDTFRRNRGKNNMTAMYFGWASLLGSLTMLFFGYPVLFTQDPNILSFGTFIGDVLYAIAMLILWLIYIRVFLTYHPKVRNIARVFVFLLTAAVIAEAVHRNLILETSTYVSYMNGTVSLLYNDALLYQILNGLSSLALLFTSIYFWRHGKEAATLGQRMRIRGLAIGFTIFALSFPVTPSFPVDQQSEVNFSILLLGMLVVAITTVLGSLLQNRDSKKPTQPTTPTN